MKGRCNMNDNLQTWNYESSEIRTIEKDGEPWFVGKDVADILEYTNTAKAVRDHVDDEDKLTERIVLSGQNREVIFINESGLYSLILSSKLPNAKKFKRWVTNEVLPSIRKHGAYMTEQTLERIKALEVKEMNARVRMSNQFLKLANVDTSMSKDYKAILIAKSAQVLAGEEILPLPKAQQKMYTATEIGNMFGVSKQKIGAIANQHGLKVAEYGEFYKDKSPYSNKEVDAFRYNDDGVAQFRKLLG